MSFSSKIWCWHTERKIQKNSGDKTDKNFLLSFSTHRVILHTQIAVLATVPKKLRQKNWKKIAAPRPEKTNNCVISEKQFLKMFPWTSRKLFWQPSTEIFAYSRKFFFKVKKWIRNCNFLRQKSFHKTFHLDTQRAGFENPVESLSRIVRKFSQQIP